MAAEDALADLIAAFNNPNPTALNTFLTEQSALAEAAPRWAIFRRGAGPLRLVRIEGSGQDAVTATMEDRWERPLRIKLRTAAEPPHRITAASVVLGQPTEPTPPMRMTWPQVKRALEAKIAEGVARDWLSGALMVSSYEESLFEAAYGYADREAQTPNALDTRFRIGSMNKMFTGVAVLQLAQAGSIGLDDFVGRHLPDYPSRSFAETVTIRHLLNHTGGAGDFFGRAFREHRLELRDPQDYVDLFGHRAPEFEPGSQHKYANYGFILLGRMIETVSGGSYDDYVQANIFGVAGMCASGAQPEESELEGRAVGYMDSPAGLVRNDETLPFRGTPAGGGYSTVGDLVRFAHALTAGKLLDPKHMQPIGAGGVELRPGVNYGAGFEEYRQGGVRSLGHGGGAPGMSGMLLISPHTGYVVTALANGDPPQARGLCEFVNYRLPAT